MLRQTLTSVLSEGTHDDRHRHAGLRIRAPAQRRRRPPRQPRRHHHRPQRRRSPPPPARSRRRHLHRHRQARRQQGATLAAAVLAEASELIAGAGALPATAAAEVAPPEISSAQHRPRDLLARPRPRQRPQHKALQRAIAQEILELAAGSPTLAPTAVPADAAARAAATSAALSLLQEAIQASPLAAANLSRLLTENGQALALLPVVTGARTSAIDDPDFARTNLPPPPVNGALPAAQPVASATLSAHMPLNTALAAPAGRHRWRDRAANPVADRFTAGAGRSVRLAHRCFLAALEF